jgi:hypothetical protein
MNFNWVLANGTDLSPDVDLGQLKNIGSLWGSWQTWRAYQTDNVICHNAVKALDLITKKMHTVCNLYVPNEVFVALDEPERVMPYGGDFSHEVAEQDEIVAMHLVATLSDIVLLLGFDWGQRPLPVDSQPRLLRHNYVNLVREAIAGNPKTQWVLIDHAGPVMSELAHLENLTQDSLTNVFGMLNP